MEIKAKSRHDIENFKSGSNVMLFGKRNPRMQFWVWLTFNLLISGLATVLCVTRGNFAIFLAMCFSLYSTFRFLYLSLLRPRLAYKHSGFLKDREINFVFCDEAYTVWVDTEEIKGPCEIKYSLVGRVIETSENFFIYVWGRTIHIVRKSCMESADIEALRAKLLSITPKYFVANY